VKDWDEGNKGNSGGMNEWWSRGSENSPVVYKEWNNYGTTYENGDFTTHEFGAYANEVTKNQE